MFLLSKDYVPRRFKCDAKLGQCLADSGAHCNTPFVQSDENKQKSIKDGIYYHAFAEKWICALQCLLWWGSIELRIAHCKNYENFP